LAEAHIPGLIESFRIDGKVTNVIKTWKFKTYNLDQVNIQYTDGLNPRHIGWMFKRLLAAIALAHKTGVVHGHIIPTNYLVCPEDHNGLLIDWCGGGEVGSVSTFMVPQYQDFYAPEIWHSKPIGFYTDIYMAAKLMIYALGGNPVRNQFPGTTPKLIIDFLRGCVIHTPSKRPQDAGKVLNDFVDVLEEVYGAPKWCDLQMI
jgi:serine/threonine protein kinase